MPIPLSLTFVSMLAFGLQFVIFVYLYTSNRARFFQYLVWAWGLFTLSKGLKCAETLAPPDVGLDGPMNAVGIAAQLCIAAAVLAYRWDYHLGWRAAGVGGLVAVGLAVLGHGGPSGLDPAIGILLGAAQIVFGLAFWPRPSRGTRYRGARLLAGTLAGWGLHRIAMQFVETQPGTPLYLGVHAMFLIFYFLATFAIIIMVLDRARSEVRALKEFNERLVDGLREGIELVDGDYTIRHANRWMLENFGPVAGRRCHEVLTADGRRCPGCPMERRELMTGPVRLEVQGPGDRRFLLSCSPVRQPDGELLLLELVADVTEQEEMRRRLHEAQRLAAAGELAAGVAHEIRNPLSAIVNATTLLDGDDALTPEERSDTLAAVRTEARRLNRILSDFLLFARPREPRRIPGDIGEVVERVAGLIRDDPTRGKDVELEVRVDRSVPAVAFDSDQIAQVLWNVALNGVEAMNGRGRLSFDVGRRDGEVVITVADNGCGIPPEERERVFQPFYSRKPGGSGLGLTIADRIVSAHGGRIALDSAPGRGTRFIIALPVGAA